MTILEQISAGDRVAVRWSFTGTHQGELAGQPPSGRGFEVEGISVLRLAEGQICEHGHQRAPAQQQFFQRDTVGLSRQLGLSLV